MSLDEVSKKIESKLDGLRESVQALFDRVINQMNKFTDVLVVAIIGIARFIATVFSSMMRLVGAGLRLFLIIVPFLLFIPAGFEIGGAVGVTLAVISIGTVVASPILLIWLIRNTKSIKSLKTEDSLKKSEVQITVVVLSIIIIGIMTAYMLHRVPRHLTMRPLYRILLAIEGVMGEQHIVTETLEPDEELYTFIEVEPRDNLRVVTSDSVRIFLEDSGNQRAIAILEKGDTLLCMAATGVVTLQSCGRQTSVTAGVVEPNAPGR